MCFDSAQQAKCDDVAATSAGTEIKMIMHATAVQRTLQLRTSRPEMAMQRNDKYATAA
jgi:hypothetical protein